MPDARGWTLVENNEILQPEEARKDDKYIVYLKEETDPNTYSRCKILSMWLHQKEEGVDQTTVEEIVKLPVTFDSGTILFIALGIIVLALVIVAIIKRTNKRWEQIIMKKKICNLIITILVIALIVVIAMIIIRYGKNYLNEKEISKTLTTIEEELSNQSLNNENEVLDVEYKGYKIEGIIEIQK